MSAASQQHNSAHRGHLPQDAGMSQLADHEFDTFETQVLEIARRFFQAFSDPESEAWIEALRRAEEIFPVPFGATIANAILIALNDMRCSRMNLFSFINPCCPNCAQNITDEERYLLSALHNVRRGRRSLAETECMLLCEGNDTTKLIASLERVAIITGDVSTPQFN